MLVGTLSTRRGFGYLGLRYEEAWMDAEEGIDRNDVYTQEVLLVFEL